MPDEGACILLVEDEADHRLLFRKMLAAGGSPAKVVATDTLMVYSLP